LFLPQAATIVILCDNNNICEACSEAFATQFFIGSNLLYNYLNLLTE
jgi:hypothetical protein